MDRALASGDDLMNEISEQRRRDLETHIQETLQLLKEYEDKRRLSGDPREKRRCEREIAELRRLLDSYQSAQQAIQEISGVVRGGESEFVNRESELLLLRVERLRASRSPYTLISAPAGYGKSYLLQHLIHTVEADDALRQKWCVRYVDFSSKKENGDQVAYVVHAIDPGNQVLSEKPGFWNEPDTATDLVCNHVVQELGAPLPEGRRAVLLIFDAVERLDEKTRQWLYTLLNDLRRRTRPGDQEIITVRVIIRRNRIGVVIIAGRNVEPFWEGYAQAYPKLPAPQRINLSPFDERPIQELIWSRAQAARIGLDAQTVFQIAEEVQYLSGGHPSVIRSLVDNLASLSFAIGPTSKYFQRHRERLVRTVLSPVANSLLESLQASLGVETREAARTLSVLRRVNANTVQALIEAGALPPETNEVDLLGDMQRAHLLEGPGIREPFYRDHLMRRIWALDMAHGSPESRAQYHRLNKIALDLYRNWIHNLGQGLPDAPLKAAQRLLSVVEWLFHALQDEDMDEDGLRTGLQEHVRVLPEGSQPPSVADLIADEIKQDAELCYLLRHRLGDDGVFTVCNWLNPT